MITLNLNYIRVILSAINVLITGIGDFGGKLQFTSC